MALAIVDADPIVYRAGFAGQSNELHVVWEDDDGNVDQEIFIPGEKTANAQLQEWLMQKAEAKYGKEWNEKESGLKKTKFIEEYGPEILSKDIEVVPEELDHVLSTVRAILRDCTYQAAQHFGVDSNEINLRVLLSGPGNFREQVATVWPYKGNRKDDHKPYWYQQIRNYMTEWWDAEVIEGREADDECSIAQKQADGHSIICTIDKDLDQVPGHHYDYVKKVLYYTAPEEGDLLFYKQVLSGDSTDNIPGCFKVGAVRAAKLVDAYYLEHGMSHDGIWNLIVETYQGSLEQYGRQCPYYDLAEEKGTEAVALEMARLVKMQDYVGQLWTPHGRPDEVLDMEFEE